MKSYLSLIIFIFVVIVAVANAADGMYLEVMTDEATIKFKEEEFDASGGILFKYDDIKIKAFKIKKVKDKNVVIAQNKVIFQQGDKTVECDEIEVNLDTKEAIIKDGGTMMDKIYYGGEMFDAKFPDIAVVRNAYFSTCNLEDPHYHFEAKKIEFYPGRKIVAYNTFLYIGNIKTIWLPMYVSSVKSDGQRATLFPKFGSSEEEGNYVIWGLEYELNKKYLKGFSDLEWSAKKGFIINQWSNDYEISENNNGNLSLKKYLIPKNGADKEYDFVWTHKIKTKADSQEKDEPWKLSDIKKPSLAYTKFKKMFKEGNWDLFYENQTTNLLKDSDGNPIENSGKNKLKKYEVKGTQKIGEDLSVSANVLWSDSEVLKNIINNEDSNQNGTDNDILKSQTDNEIYKKFNITKDNKDYKIAVDYDKTTDLDPGWQNDDYSYKDNQKLELQLKRYKIRFNYSDSDRDVFKTKAGNSYKKIIDYDYKKDYTYTLELGDYNIFDTKFFYGLNYKRVEKDYLKRKYINEQLDVDYDKYVYGVDYVKDEDESINTKYTEYGARFGNSEVPLWLAGKMNLAYKYNRADFDTGEALDKHIIKSAVTTDVFDNTNNEAGKFDLVIKNEIPSSYSFAKTANGIRPSESNFPDKTLEIGDLLTFNLGNTNNSYKINFTRSDLDDTNIKSGDGMSHALRFGVDKDSLELSFNNNNTYFTDESKKSENVSGKIEYRGNNKIYSYSRTESRYYDEKTGDTTSNNIKDSYNYTKGKLTLTYNRTKYNTGTVSNLIYTEVTKTITDEYLARYEKQKEYIKSVLETRYSQGYDYFNSKKADGVLSFTFEYDDKSYQKEQKKEEEVKKGVAVNNTLVLTEEELIKAQEIFSQNKNKDKFDLKGIGQEKKVQELDKSKNYQLSISTTIDRDYADKNGISFLDSKAFKKLDGKFRYKYSTLIDWDGGITLAKSVGGGTLSDKKYNTGIQLQIGPDTEYKWWVGYKINYTEKENGTDLSRITAEKYFIKKQLHCTMLEINYERNWLDSKSKFENKFGLVFSIVAFPEKGIGIKYEDGMPGFEAGM